VASKVSRNAAVNGGDTYNLSATARYIRVNMTYSSTNMSVNITDFKAYGTPAVGLPAYTLNSAAGGNGSISPSGTVIVNRGTKQTYAIIPSSGYQVSDVVVDGVSVGALSSYTFNYVTANHTISATFKTLKTYTITSSANTGGTIDPSGTTVVNEGAALTYNITASSGYTIDHVLVDNNPVGAVTTYTFSNVSTGHVIQAVFVPVYQIFAFVPDVDEGTITPPDETMVKQGSNQSYTITPSSGYAIEQVYADGEPVGAVSTYTFTNVTMDHNIFATFLPQYQIFAFVQDVDEGTISPIDGVMVTQGLDQTFTITANPGFAIDQVYVDGDPVGAVSTYIFFNVNSGHNIYAEFKSISGLSKVNFSGSMSMAQQDNLTSMIPESMVKDPMLEVNPNPFNEYFKMIITSPARELFEVSVINLSGKIVYSRRDIPTNTEITIGLSAESGIYLLFAHNRKSTSFIKLIKY
jgi:hypothetical protein